MTSLAERYIREMHNSLDYWAAWAPGVEIKLGDCGRLDDDWAFLPERNIKAFGIDFSVDESPSTTPWSHTSDHAMTFTFQVQGGEKIIPQIPQGTAGIQIDFHRENAVVFAAVEGRHSRIADIYELKRQVLDLARKGQFPNDFVVVTEVVKAESATVLLSVDKEGKYVASASADFKAGIVDVGNASLNISTQVADKVKTEIVAKNHVTPLFRAVKLHKGFLDYKVSPLEAAAEEDLPFVDLTPTELDQEA